MMGDDHLLHFANGRTSCGQLPHLVEGSKISSHPDIPRIRIARQLYLTSHKHGDDVFLSTHCGPFRHQA